MILNGSSEFIGEIASCISMFCFNLVIMKHLGVDGVTAFTVVGYTAYIFSMIVVGFGQGICPLVSFVFGAKDVPLAIKIRKQTNKLVFAVGIIFALTLFFGANTYANIFVKEVSVQKIISSGIKLFSGTFLITGVNVIGSMYFTSCGKALPSAIISALRGIVLLNIAIFIFPVLWGLTGLWILTPIVEFLTAIVTSIFCIKENQMLKAQNN